MIGSTSLYEPISKKMRVAGFLSGSGSVIENVIEKSDNYEIVVLFSDNCNSSVSNLGSKYDIPVVIRDLNGFCKKHNVSKYNLKARIAFDIETLKVLKCFDISLIAYAGYMSLVTDPLVNSYLGINIHPADLSITNKNGRRKYVGVHAVRDAILNHERFIKSTTHILTNVMDGGPILMMSENVEILENIDTLEDNMKNNLINDYQNKLKHQGDYVIFPLTLKYIAEGKFSKDYYNNIYFEEKLLHSGLQL